MPFHLALPCAPWKSLKLAEEKLCFEGPRLPWKLLALKGAQASKAKTNDTILIMLFLS